MKTLTLVLLAATICGALGQGAVPQRLQIPGAISLGPKPSGNFRQGRLIQLSPPNQQPLRIRRPGQQRAGAFKSVASPSPFLQQLDDSSKPVNEEPEELPELSTPQPFISSISPFSIPSQLSEDESPQLFLNASPVPKPIISIPNAIPATQVPPTRPPEPLKTSPPSRPPPPSPSSPAPARFEAPSPNRYEAPVRQQQPVRLAPLSFRPQRPQYRPQQDDDDEEEQPIRQTYRQPTVRPQQQQAQHAPVQKYTPSREKKPVAQNIRKYREDNADGSITWGFENDDGSFKEETIGIDCVTRGRYGYVDPDGLKREYNYETGIPCDKAKEEQEQQGFIDYQENKAILPNGIVLDLAAMGKKSKRPTYQTQGRN